MALWEGKVYVGVADGRLIALDAKSGRVVWQTQTFDRSKQYFITGAPRVFDGKVIIGQGGGDNYTRGYASAYDAKTGKARFGGFGLCLEIPPTDLNPGPWRWPQNLARRVVEVWRRGRSVERVRL